MSSQVSSQTSSDMAVKYACNYKSPDGSRGWYLPSFGEMSESKNFIFKFG